jgi:hypothetical protein
MPTDDELDDLCLRQLRGEYEAWRAVWLAGQPVEGLPWVNDVGMTVMLEHWGIFVSKETARTALDRLVARGRATVRRVVHRAKAAHRRDRNIEVLTPMDGYTYLNLLDELARAANGDFV